MPQIDFGMNRPILQIACHKAREKSPQPFDVTRQIVKLQVSPGWTSDRVLTTLNRSYQQKGSEHVEA